MPGAFQVMGIAGELRQVLANLLANSLDARSGRKIVVRASACTDPHGGRGCGLPWQMVGPAWQQRRSISSTHSLRPRARWGTVLDYGCASNWSRNTAARSGFGLRQRDGGKEPRFLSYSLEILGHQSLQDRTTGSPNRQQPESKNHRSPTQ